MNANVIQYFGLIKKLGKKCLVSPIIRVGLILGVLGCLFLPYAGEVEAAAVPTFGVVSTSPGTSVTIQTANFPDNQTFTVRVGEYGTLAIGGIVVGTTNSGPGGVFQATYNIPDALKDRKYLAIRMDSSTGYYYSYSWFVNKSDGTLPPNGMTPDGTTYGGPYYYPGNSGIPTFSIHSVDPGKSVTIQTNNFPVNQDFTVRMGLFGTLAIGGDVVASTNSGSGGSFQATYTIPDDLKNQQYIAIRTDSSSGYYYSYNWFQNNVNGITPGGTWPQIPGYQGIPTFSISSVDLDNKVTIKAYNFPPNQSFTVRMGNYGTTAIGGTIVATTDSGAGGSFEATYTIPDWLKGRTRIAIRMDSPTGYYFAYNWFWNNTAATANNSTGNSPVIYGYYGIPTFSISSVIQDGKVTIQTSPFPPNQTFTVRMGVFGTAAIGGTVVGTTTTGNGGAFTATYDIPDWLKGSSQIAIRMDSSTGYYYAYNWFWNNTTN